MSSTPATAQRSPDPQFSRLPAHVGIIMDGNGRWAAARGLPRSEGHRAGLEAVRRTVDCAIRHGLDCLTLYGFSAENWSRPREEIGFLFGLLRRFVASDLALLLRRNVRIRVIGDRQGLDASLRGIIEDAERKTQGNTGLDLTIAFNYGARQEIAGAARALAEAAATGGLDPARIDDAMVARHLSTAGLPDPDLVIRTSGEMRLSNFLLWQAAYAELVFLEENWPDFDETHFLAALRIYADRDRRFGGVGT